MVSSIVSPSVGTRLIVVEGAADFGCGIGDVVVDGVVVEVVVEMAADTAVVVVVDNDVSTVVDVGSIVGDSDTGTAVEDAASPDTTDCPQAARTVDNTAATTSTRPFISHSKSRCRDLRYPFWSSRIHRGVSGHPQ